MPEGDTIHKGAHVMRPLLVGRVLAAVRCRWPRIVTGLAGRTVTAVDVRGKHLLLGFDDGTVLRVHLGMEGSWARWEPDERVPGQRTLGLLLVTAEDAFACYHPKEVERLERHRLHLHSTLASLGPDLAAGPVNLDDVLSRAREILAAAHDASLLVEDLLLDQRPACGIGNVFKSEVLFLGKVHPLTPAHTLDDATLLNLYRIANRLLPNAVTQERRNTTGRRSPELYVYGRRAEPCLRCGTAIVKRAQTSNERVTYFCPGCQPALSQGLG